MIYGNDMCKWKNERNPLSLANERMKGIPFLFKYCIVTGGVTTFVRAFCKCYHRATKSPNPLELAIVTGNFQV